MLPCAPGIVVHLETVFPLIASLNILENNAPVIRAPRSLIPADNVDLDHVFLLTSLLSIWFPGAGQGGGHVERPPHHSVCCTKQSQVKSQAVGDGHVSW